MMSGYWRAYSGCRMLDRLRAIPLSVIRIDQAVHPDAKSGHYESRRCQYKDGFLWVAPDKFRESFCQDLDETKHW